MSTLLLNWNLFAVMHLKHNSFYLKTKAARSGHYIDFDGKEHLPEQDDPVIVEAGGLTNPSSPSVVDRVRVGRRGSDAAE